MKEHVIFINRNGKNCYYLVTDLNINDGLMTFHIEDDLYVYEMSLVAFSSFLSGIVDCTKLKLLSIIPNAQ